MNAARGALCALATGAVLLALLSAGCSRNTSSQAADKPTPASGQIAKGVGPDIGYTAPDFALNDLGGATVRLSDYRGRVVLLNFWATWCGPCRIEMPALQALEEDYAERGLRVVSVAGDFEGARRVAPFVAEMGVHFPALLDADGRVQDQYLVRMLPTTLILDRQGTVVYKFVGFFDWNRQEYRERIERLLAGA